MPWIRHNDEDDDDDDMLIGVWWQRRQDSGKISVSQFAVHSSLCAISPAAVVASHQHESRTDRLPVQRY